MANRKQSRRHSCLPVSINTHYTHVLCIMEIIVRIRPVRKIVGNLQLHVVQQRTSSEWIVNTPEHDSQLLQRE